MHHVSACLGAVTVSGSAAGDSSLRAEGEEEHYEGGDEDDGVMSEEELAEVEAMYGAQVSAAERAQLPARLNCRRRVSTKLSQGTW